MPNQTLSKQEQRDRATNYMGYGKKLRVAAPVVPAEVKYMATSSSNPKKNDDFSSRNLSSADKINNENALFKKVKKQTKPEQRQRAAVYMNKNLGKTISTSTKATRSALSKQEQRQLATQYMKRDTKQKASAAAIKKGPNQNKPKKYEQRAKAQNYMDKKFLAQTKMIQHQDRERSLSKSASEDSDFEMEAADDSSQGSFFSADQSKHEYCLVYVCGELQGITAAIFEAPNTKIVVGASLAVSDLVIPGNTAQVAQMVLVHEKSMPIPLLQVASVAGQSFVANRREISNGEQAWVEPNQILKFGNTKLQFIWGPC